AATKAKLVGSLHPTDVLGNRGIRSVVRLAGNCGPAPDGKAQPAGDGEVDHLAAQGSIVRAEIRQRPVIVVDLHDVGTASRKAQGTDEVGANQVRVSNAQLVIQVIDTIRVDRQRVLSIKRGIDLERSSGEAAENGVLLAFLPVHS